jgi:hypothetical protein
VKERTDPVLQALAMVMAALLALAAVLAFGVGLT